MTKSIINKYNTTQNSLTM